ncbi:MAG: tRNA dihydrouridine synthase DusB [Candidatus Riflebacteria bacterium]|nr:tRNA dihydrouridine synthase DusB [Candidatus Riflebacteria bacterium]
MSFFTDSPITSWIGNPSAPFDSSAQNPVKGSKLEGIIKPIKIGNVQLPNNLVLAPMAGVTDGSFRQLCARLGAGYSVSELASCKALQMRSSQTIEMIKFDGNTGPYAVQIFGADPDLMAEAASFVESLKICDIIDINMGCPVSKVVKTGAGSALMKTPDLAANIIKSVSKAVSLPVTCKFRSGWTENSINVKEFAHAVIEAGAKAITVHARTRQAMYTGSANWKYLEGIKEISGPIPFIANGDICSEDNVIELYERTGCDGFMIGRGCVGKPWLYAQLLGHTELLQENFRFPIFKHHLTDMLMEHGSTAVPLFRVHLFGYLKNHPHSASLRRSLCMERNPNVVLQAGKDFFDRANPIDREA